MVWRTNTSHVNFDNLRVTGSPGSYNTLVYLHGDHLGSIGAVTNSSGALLDMTRFLPFGGFRGSDPAFLSERAFTGHKMNNTASNDLGLVFMGARYYLPSIGRFASPDIIIPNPADPQSYNRYSYVLNSPTGLRDASGHCIFAVADTILCLAAAAKIVDYVWTAWDTGWAMHTLADSNASQGEKVVAALNIGMAVFFEVVEPDDLLPVGVPLDDVARRTFMNGAEEALEAGGDAGLRAYVKDQIGDEAADTVFNKMDELLGGCAFNSFQAGTMVMTDSGPVPIEEIEPGDLVLAYNEATGEIGYYPVTDLISHIDIQVVYLTIDGETIVTTAEHPFYTDANTWLDAGELQMGDELRTATWDTGAVESVTIVTQPQRMYNFTVAAAHTYFVGDGQWLVHNTSGPGFCARNIAEHSSVILDDFADYGVENLDDLEGFINFVKNNADESGNLRNGRSYYWLDDGDGYGVVLIIDPNSSHGGTIFRPEDGILYLDTLK